ncbi:MAG: hypothetical protein BWX61_00876 [Bacteroidetes bacterium ADurb.Bin035]|nr:MAG: hypothetical protein BWX61_00876 [Bacteroidetes bacterium ADurb.Bin035]
MGKILYLTVAPNIGVVYPINKVSIMVNDKKNNKIFCSF